MDATVPYLRTQAELLADIEALQRDTSNARWTEVEIYRAINQSLLTWAEKVKMPRIYTITGGWLASTFAYDLASYMRPPFYPQLLRQLPFNEDQVESGTETWQDVPGWEVEINSTGGLTLRPHALPRSVEGRIIWYAPNSRVPTTLPTSSGEITSTATSVTLGSAVDIDDVGYIKINAEYMAYSGVTRNASTTVLTNLIRGLNGSTAATQATGSSVTWCIGVDTLALYNLLYNQVRAILNALPLTDGGVHETGRYEKMMGYYQQLADAYWPLYKPQRKMPGITLSRKIFSLR